MLELVSGSAKIIREKEILLMSISAKGIKKLLTVPAKWLTSLFIIERLNLYCHEKSIKYKIYLYNIKIHM